MELYTKPGNEYTPVINENLKSKEYALVSIPMEYNGSVYRKVLYYEAKLGKFASKPVGIVFLSEDGEIVKEKEMKRQLVLCFRRMELMLGSRSTKRFSNAYTSERQLQGEERDYQDMIEAMEPLKEKGTEGTEAVSQVLINIAAAKREINEAMVIYKECMDKCIAQKDRVLADNIDSFYEAYIGVMVANFKKVKLINTAYLYYDGVRKAAVKMGRSIKMLFSYGRVKKGLSDIDFQLSYFSRFLSIYKDVIHMNIDRYKVYLKDMENHEVAYNVKLLR
jgi:hypothetical protein